MGKTVKLVKNALKNPSMFSFGELTFFQHWLEQRKARKKAKKEAKKKPD